MGFYAFVAGEIGGDELGGFFLWDIDLLGEAEGGEAVDDAEIDGFGGAAMLGGLSEGPDAKNFLGSTGVDVFAVAEGVDEHGVLREVSHHGVRFASSRRRLEF